LHKNSQEAFASFVSAAENGDMVAQYYVGVCYLTGEGVVCDQIQALKWLTLSAQQSYGPSVKLSELLASKLTQNQLDTVRRLVADWVLSSFS
jgi:TPR repeat protein